MATRHGNGSIVATLAAQTVPVVVRHGTVKQHAEESAASYMVGQHSLLGKAGRTRGMVKCAKRGGMVVWWRHLLVVLQAGAGVTVRGGMVTNQIAGAAPCCAGNRQTGCGGRCVAQVRLCKVAHPTVAERIRSGMASGRRGPNTPGRSSSTRIMNKNHHPDT